MAFKSPSNYYVISDNMRPGLKMVNGHQLYKRFKIVLEKAVNAQLIDNSEGLSFASWRKTGMDYWSYKLETREFKDHNRHDNFSTAEVYLKSRHLIKSVSIAKDDVFQKMV